VESDQDAFSTFLRGHGLKLTQQRRLVLEQALRAPKHFSAEELLLELRRKDSSISKATLYRTLALLCEAHLLDSVDFERGYKLYEPARSQEHHDHLICTSCGRIVEFHDEGIETAQNLVAEAHDFEIAWHTHKLYGLCKNCRARSPRGRGRRVGATRRAQRRS
jgi:Fur family ferric uptake transcriptional regulator